MAGIKIKTRGEGGFDHGLKLFLFGGRDVDKSEANVELEFVPASNCIIRTYLSLNDPGEPFVRLEQVKEEQNFPFRIRIEQKVAVSDEHVIGLQAGPFA